MILLLMIVDVDSAQRGNWWVHGASRWRPATWAPRRSWWGKARVTTTPGRSAVGPWEVPSVPPVTDPGGCVAAWMLMNHWQTKDLRSCDCELLAIRFTFPPNLGYHEEWGPWPPPSAIPSCVQESVFWNSRWKPANFDIPPYPSTPRWRWGRCSLGYLKNHIKSPGHLFSKPWFTLHTSVGYCHTLRFLVFLGFLNGFTLGFSVSNNSSFSRGSAGNPHEISWGFPPSHLHGPRRTATRTSSLA